MPFRHTRKDSMGQKLYNKQNWPSSVKDRLLLASKNSCCTVVLSPEDLPKEFTTEKIHTTKITREKPTWELVVLHVKLRLTEGIKEEFHDYIIWQCRLSMTLRK